MILPQMSILILILQQKYYTPCNVMVVTFLSISFKQQRCLKRIKDMKGLVEIRVDCGLASPTVVASDHINMSIFWASQ